MLLSEKLCQLRTLEGQLRNLGRPMTKSEVVRAMRAELGQGISHAYLCQLENGSREHMSAGSRALLASFFKVHPGYLVSDPDDYQTGIVSDLAAPSDLKGWLAVRAEEMRDDPVVYHALLRLSHEADPRRFFVALSKLLDMNEDALEQLLAQPDGEPAG